MPTSPLVRMLNARTCATTADLHVLGGDLAGAGVFGRLKTLVTDFYYRDDHDLVVNTPAMLGGIERTQPVRYWIDTGDQVTHFHYFARPDTARRLVVGADRIRRRLQDARGDGRPRSRRRTTSSARRCRSPSCSCCRASWGRS